MAILVDRALPALVPVRGDGGRSSRRKREATKMSDQVCACVSF